MNGTMPAAFAAMSDEHDRGTRSQASGEQRGIQREVIPERADRGVTAVMACAASGRHGRRHGSATIRSARSAGGRQQDTTGVA